MITESTKARLAALKDFEYIRRRNGNNDATLRLPRSTPITSVDTDALEWVRNRQ